MLKESNRRALGVVERRVLRTVLGGEFEDGGWIMIHVSKTTVLLDDVSC